MVVKDGKIDTVTVLEHNETEGLSDAAMENIPQSIVDGQTINVDTVSGASNSVNGIIEAVSDCIVQAGGNLDDFKLASGDEASGEVFELSTDVSIVFLLILFI